jgi:hypothetical protein
MTWIERGVELTMEWTVNWDLDQKKGVEDLYVLASGKQQGVA